MAQLCVCADRLRTKSGGHHLTVEQVVRAQFGGPFDDSGPLRRRRSEIEYPQRPGDGITRAEVLPVIEQAVAMVAAAAQLGPRLTMFR